MTHTALLLIDIQNDYFADGQWPLSGIEAASARAAHLLAACRKHGLPVVHVQHEFISDTAPFFLSGSTGAQIHPSVTPLPGEPIILKHKANSFQDTELKPLLDALNINKLIIAGAMSHLCIDAGVRAAADFGYAVHVAEDACATCDQVFNGNTVPAAQVHAAFMAALAFAYAEVSSTEQILAELG